MPKPMYERSRRDSYGNPVYGFDRKSRRESADKALVSFITFVLLAALAGAAIFAMKTYVDKASKPKLYEDAKERYVPIATTETNDGKMEWYVMTDPEKRIQYLVNDRGGCTPRLDSYEEVTGASLQ